MVQQLEAVQAARMAKEAYAITWEAYHAAIAAPDVVNSLPEDGAEVGPFHFKVFLPNGGRHEPHFGIIRASRKCLRIATKGTADAACWVFNVDFRAVSLTNVRTTGILTTQFMEALRSAARTKNIDPDRVTLHRGFLNYVLSSLEDLWPTVQAWLKATAMEPDRSVDISGHSLGGAASSILALAIAGLEPAVNVRCITFGSPKVFRSAQAVKLFTQSVGVVARFVAQMGASLVTDLVPLVPPAFNHPGPQRTLRVTPTPALEEAINKRKTTPWAVIGAGVLELHSMDGYLEMVERLAETEIQTVGVGADASIYRLAGYALNATMTLVQMETTAKHFATVLGILQTATNVDEVAQKLAAEGVTASETPFLAKFFSELGTGDCSLQDLTKLAMTLHNDWQKNCSLQAAIRVAHSVFQEAEKVTTLCCEVEASRELFDAAKASLAIQRGRVQTIRGHDLPALAELIHQMELLDDTARARAEKVNMASTFEENTRAILRELRDIEEVLDKIAIEAGVQIDILDAVFDEVTVSGIKSVFDMGFCTYQAMQGNTYNMAWTGLAAASMYAGARATKVGIEAKNLQDKWRELRSEVEDAKAEVEQVKSEVLYQSKRMKNLVAGRAPES